MLQVDTNNSRTEKARGRLAFGAFAFDPKRGCLVRGDDEIPLRPKSLVMLLHLLENPGRLVTREELMKAVWPDVVVTDDSITQCLIEIRKAIGDDQREMIRTVPRRGLIFEEAVEVRRTPRPERTAAERSVLLRPGVSSLGAVVLIAVLAWLYWNGREDGGAEVTSPVLANSLAVLPFEITRANTAPLEIDLLTEALADELRDQLARVPALRVSARSSSLASAHKGLDAVAAAEALDVAYVVEGRVTRRSEQLRVSIQLIEGASGLAVWSNTYERGPREWLATQQNIAEEIVTRVAPNADPAAIEPATRNPTANELMMLAGVYEQRVRLRQNVDESALLRTITLYRQAIESDPGSALAHSRLAGALLFLGDVDAAEEPIATAVGLNPRLSEVQTTLGEYYWARGLPESDAAFREAIELNPDNADAHAHLANLRWLTHGKKDFPDGLTPERLFRRAVELDRLSLARHAALGEFLGRDGRVEETREVIGTIETLFDSPEAYRVLGWLNELVGQLDLAIAWTLRARDLEPDNPDHVAKLAHLFAIIGDDESALRLEPEPSFSLLFRLRRYEEAIDIGEFLMIDHPADLQVRYLLGFSYTATGRFEEAERVLRAISGERFPTTAMVRSVSEIEAYFVYLNAVHGMGRTAEAEALAQLTDRTGWWGDIGWISLWRSCVLSIGGRREEALATLAGMRESARFPPRPQLLDSHCFKPLANEPAYRSLVAHDDQRRAELRRELPLTLSRFGVSSSTLAARDAR